MCGRFARYHELTAWVDSLGAGTAPGVYGHLQEVPPRYNIAPGTNAWIIGLDVRGDLSVTETHWAFPTSRGNRINVRSETTGVVPEYRELFEHHRCVVSANGFYEPRGASNLKNRPWYFFRPRDGSPLFLAAIVKPQGFSILTRTPVAPVAKVHDRSPVMVSPEHILEFLDADLGGKEALRRFAPREYGEELEGWRVSDAAKRPANDGPDLIARVPDPERVFE